MPSIKQILAVSAASFLVATTATPTLRPCDVECEPEDWRCQSRPCLDRPLEGRAAMRVDKPRSPCADGTYDCYKPLNEREAAPMRKDKEHGPCADRTYDCYNSYTKREAARVDKPRGPCADGTYDCCSPSGKREAEAAHVDKPRGPCADGTYDCYSPF